MLLGWRATYFSSVSSVPLWLCVIPCPIANARSPVDIELVQHRRALVGIEPGQLRLALVDTELAQFRLALVDTELAQFHLALADIELARRRLAVEAGSFAGEAAAGIVAEIAASSRPGSFQCRQAEVQAEPSAARSRFGRFATVVASGLVAAGRYNLRLFAVMSPVQVQVAEAEVRQASAAEELARHTAWDRVASHRDQQGPAE